MLDVGLRIIQWCVIAMGNQYVMGQLAAKGEAPSAVDSLKLRLDCVTAFLFDRLGLDVDEAFELELGYEHAVLGQLATILQEAARPKLHRV